MTSDVCKAVRASLYVVKRSNVGSEDAHSHSKALLLRTGTFV